MGTVTNQGSAQGLKQLKVSVDPGIAAAFKAACVDSNVSMTAEIAKFMAGYVNGSVKRKAAPNYSTRRHRRTAIKAIVKELEQMKACEVGVLDRMPENLQGSCAYDATEEAIAVLEDAIGILAEF